MVDAECALWVRALLFVLKKEAACFQGVSFASIEDVKSRYASALKELVDECNKSMVKGAKRIKQPCDWCVGEIGEGEGEGGGDQVSSDGALQPVADPSEPRYVASQKGFTVGSVVQQNSHKGVFYTIMAIADKGTLKEIALFRSPITIDIGLQKGCQTGRASRAASRSRSSPRATWCAK